MHLAHSNNYFSLSLKAQGNVFEGVLARLQLVLVRMVVVQHIHRQIVLYSAEFCKLPAALAQESCVYLMKKTVCKYKGEMGRCDITAAAVSVTLWR